MAPATPRISVVLPTLDQADFLPGAIESVIAQDYPETEFIVIDGGSRDHTVDVLRRYESHLAYWVSEPDHGQCHAINKGFARATGDIFYWHNTDDVVEAGAFHYAAGQLADVSRAQWLVGAARLIDKQGRAIGVRTPGPVDENTFLLWCIRWIPTQSVFWTRPMWDAAGPFDESLHYVMDLSQWQRMYRVAPAIVTDRILASYRLHWESKSFSNVPKSRAERKRHIKKLIVEEIARAQNGDSGRSIDEIAENLAVVLDELGDEYVIRERMRKHRILGPILRRFTDLRRNAILEP